MEDSRVAGEFGASVYGTDAEGNQTMTTFPAGARVPDVGTVRFDDNGNPNGYFGSNGYWNAWPPTAEFTGKDVRIEQLQG